MGVGRQQRRGFCRRGEKKEKSGGSASTIPSPHLFNFLFYFTLHLFRLKHFGDLQAVRDVQVLFGLMIVNAIIHL